MQSLALEGHLGLGHITVNKLTKELKEENSQKLVKAIINLKHIIKQNPCIFSMVCTWETWKVVTSLGILKGVLPVMVDY